MGPWFSSRAISDTRAHTRAVMGGGGGGVCSVGSYTAICIIASEVTYLGPGKMREGLLLFRSEAVRTCRPIKRSIILSLRETWMFGVEAGFQQRIMASDFHCSFLTLTMRGQSRKAERDGVKNFQNTQGHPDCSRRNQHCWNPDIWFRKLPGCNIKCEEHRETRISFSSA